MLYFDKSIRIFNKARIISQTLPFNKIALLTVKHFDGRISERSNDFFLCECTHARGKRQKALYKKCVLGSTEKLTGTN